MPAPTSALEVTEQLLCISLCSGEPTPACPRLEVFMKGNSVVATIGHDGPCHFESLLKIPQFSEPKSLRGLRGYREKAIPDHVVFFDCPLEMEHSRDSRLPNFVADCVAVVTRESKLVSSILSEHLKNVSVRGIVSARIILLHPAPSKPGACPSLGVCHDLDLCRT